MTEQLSLLPHQFELVESYASKQSPRIVALAGPVGVGKSTALMAVASDRAKHGELVVVVVPRVFVDTWRRSLAERFDVSVKAVYERAADLRMVIDESSNPWPTSGVVLIATNALRAPVLDRALVQLSDALLIVDDEQIGSNSSVGAQLSRVVSAGGVRVIAVARGIDVSWLPDASTRTWNYPLRDLAGHELGPTFDVRIRDYEVSEQELRSFQAAETLLRSVKVPPHIRGVSTRPGLQALLLATVRRVEAPEQLHLWPEGQAEFDFGVDWSAEQRESAAESIWHVLDAFDELPTDGRLVATIDEISEAVSLHQPVVVVAELLREVDYVLGALNEREIRAVSVTGRTEVAERASAVGTLIDGGILVVTEVFFQLSRLPDRTRSIFFSTPGTLEHVRRRLAVGLDTRDIEIVVLRSRPPLTDRDRRIEQILEEVPAQIMGRFRRIMR